MMIFALALVVSGALTPDPFIAGNPVVLRAHAGAVIAVAVSPDGKVLASASRDGKVILWDLSSGEVLRSIDGAEQQISVVSFSPDGKLLAVGETALKVRVVRVADGGLSFAVAHPDSVSGLSFSPDGSLLAVAGQSNNGAVYKLGVDKAVQSFRGRSVQFSMDGRSLNVANGAGSLAIVDRKSGRERRVVKTEPYLPYAAWGKALIASWDGREVDVRLWSTEALKPGAVLKGTGADDASVRRPRVLSVVFDADARQLATVAGDGLVRLWSLDEGKPIKSWPTDQATAVTLSKEWVIIADGALVKLWKRD